MLRKERVVAALNHKETDIVPYHVDFTTPEYEKMVDFLGDKDFCNKAGFHIHGVCYAGYNNEPSSNPDLYIDDFNVIWNRSGADKDIGVISSFVIKEPEIALWKPPVINETSFRKDLTTALENAEDKFTFAGIGFSMFERAWSLCGMENILMYMITDANFLHDLLDSICEYNLKIIDIINEYPFDGVYFGDDWGQQKGLIMGPKLWREFIKPRVKRMYERAKANSKYVIQHSCGDILDIFPDMIEIGLDCYQTFQPEIYDIKSVKKEYGNDLSFWGGISTQQLLPKASPEVVISETKRIIEIMSKSGGYIAAPTHAIPGDVPPENIVAMLDILTNQQAHR